jgi:hypothetical protein
MRVYVIYMQCEFIPCISLVTYAFMMLRNGFLYSYIIMQMNGNGCTVTDSLASLLRACRVSSVWLMQTSGMVLLSVHVVSVRIKRITLP